MVCLLTASNLKNAVEKTAEANVQKRKPEGGFDPVADSLAIAAPWSPLESQITAPCTFQPTSHTLASCTQPWDFSDTDERPTQNIFKITQICEER